MHTQPPHQAQPPQHVICIYIYVCVQEGVYILFSALVYVGDGDPVLDNEGNETRQEYPDPPQIWN